MASFKIRPAEPTDVEDILSMIQELANYLKCENQMQLTRESLLEDGFGEDKYFHCIVAEKDESDIESSVPELIGYALYFYTYSTWEGRMLYMEDLYVCPEYRGEGVGSCLWKTVAKEAVKRKCTRMQWVVANWSQSSIEYYRRNGAEDMTKEEGWHVFRMDQSALSEFASSSRRRNTATQ